MNDEQRDMLDFITGYGALDRAREDFKNMKRTYRIFTVIEIIICILIVKYFVL